MLPHGFTRRSFLSLSTALAAAAAINPKSLLDAAATTLPEITKVIPSFCEICFWKCGIDVAKSGDRIVSITGQERHPLSNGKLCPRGTGGMGNLYDPDRIKEPMMKKSGKWVAVSWDEALGFIASKMNKISDEYGCESMALLSHGYGASFLKELFKCCSMLSAPSYAQCRGPRDEAFTLTFGQSPSSPEWTDMQNSSLIVFIGSHLGENMHNTQVQDLAKAVENKAEIVVVDPRFSVVAGKANHWLPIKPGTDLALLLAWINLLIVNEGYNKSYVEEFCEGFEELRDAVAGYTPEWAYTQTGIKPEKIRETARLLAMHGSSALVHPGRKTNWYGNDTQRVRAVAILNALLGNWGRKGGFFIGEQFSIPKYPYPKHQNCKHEVTDKIKNEFPFASKIPTQALRDYTLEAKKDPIKGWMVYGTDLFNNLPNKQKTIDAIKKLDLLVVIDTLPIELTGWADVVLPDTTYLERYDDLHTPSWREPYVALRQPVVEPMYNARPSWLIAKELARHLGKEEVFPWKNIEEYLDTRLRSAGLTLPQLKRDGVALKKPIDIYPQQPAFYTETGKIALYSHELQRAGFDPVPKYEPPMEPPPGFFRLLVGRSPVHTFGRTTNNKVLTELYAENEIWVNRIAAKDFDLQNGGYVKLVNQDGIKSEKVKVKVTERIRPDAVFLVHGFGRKTPKLQIAFEKGTADNDLMSRVITDPIMGATSTNTNFVTIVLEEG